LKAEINQTDRSIAVDISLLVSRISNKKSGKTLKSFDIFKQILLESHM